MKKIIFLIIAVQIMALFNLTSNAQVATPFNSGGSDEEAARQPRQLQGCMQHSWISEPHLTLEYIKDPSRDSLIGEPGLTLEHIRHPSRDIVMEEPHLTLEYIYPSGRDSIPIRYFKAMRDSFRAGASINDTTGIAVNNSSIQTGTVVPEKLRLKVDKDGMVVIDKE